MEETLNRGGDPEGPRSATWKKTFSRNPHYDLTLTGFLPSFSPAGDRFVMNSRPSANPVGASLLLAASGSDRFDVIYHDDRRNVLAPQWSPRGDKILFGAGVFGAFFNGFHGLFLKPEDRSEGGEIYTIKPDGTSLKRLTFARGNDAHMAWSPEGERIAFASERMGFKDEAMYTDAPQPYGELFVMRYDGTGIQQLTDNQWEDGTPAWQPSRRLASRS